VMRFRDPAEKHLQGDAPAFRPLIAAEMRRDAEAKRAAAKLSPAASDAGAMRGNQAVFYVALAIMLAALAALIWIVFS